MSSMLTWASAERERDLGDRARAGSRPRSAARAARRRSRSASSSRRRSSPPTACHSADRLGVAGADQRRGVARAARSPRRSRRRPPRGWWRRCRPRSPGWRPPRGWCRESSSRPPAGARTPPRAPPRPRPTSALASTCGRWLTVAMTRSWVVGVDRLRPCAEVGDRALQAVVVRARSSAGSGSGTSARPRAARRARSRPRRSRRRRADGRR